MSGKLDIYDRRTLSKVTTIDAPNTTFCEWSPCGRFLLTATLSPRLRVDNGIKIWHCTGPLLNVHFIEELYQASWRPIPVDNVAPFPQQIPPSPVPSPSVAQFVANSKPVSAKPAGAYRPPGARGLATPSIYKREDEGGAAYTTNTTNGSMTPPRQYNRSPAPTPGSTNGYVPGAHPRNGRRHVPGAPSPSPGPGSENERKGKKSKNQKKKQSTSGNGSGTATPNAEDGATTPPKDSPPPEPQDQIKETITDPSANAAVDGAMDPVAKKIRNLNKKVRIYDSPSRTFT